MREEIRQFSWYLGLKGPVSDVLDGYWIIYLTFGKFSIAMIFQRPLNYNTYNTDLITLEF